MNRRLYSLFRCANKILAFVPLTAITLFVIFIGSQAAANDNLIAQRLLDSDRHAEAAEIYTDPAWKGVALYRSSQWWRAAEAFVRADDAASYFNLGNTYVRLGYYALALDAYNAAIAKRPEFDDAIFNAEIMRKLLSGDDKDQSQESLQQQKDEIDRVESDGAEDGTSSDEGDGDPEEKKKEGDDRVGDTDNRGPSPEASSEGESGEAGSDKTLNEDALPEGGSVKGTEGESSEDNTPSGGSEGKEETAESQASGKRSKLESEQANEQWLNQIRHDAIKFLHRRIELETSRRREAGVSAPEGGSLW